MLHYVRCRVAKGIVISGDNEANTWFVDVSDQVTVAVASCAINNNSNNNNNNCQL